MVDSIGIKSNMLKVAIDSSIKSKQSDKTNNFKITKQNEATDSNSNLIIDISSEGKLKHSSNSKRMDKISGVTASRELWEDYGVERKASRFGSMMGGMWQPNELEIMRIDEPETYEKYIDALCKAGDRFREVYGNYFRIPEGGFHPDDEELSKYVRESHRISRDWEERRMFYNVNPLGLVSGKVAAVRKLEDIYSTDEHNASFDVYNNIDNAEENLWRFWTKFNISISSDMLKKLVGQDDDEREKAVSIIDKVVNQLKEAEEKYEGKLERMRFGAVIGEDEVRYCANFLNSKSEHSVSEKSCDDLLERLLKEEDRV